MLDVDIIEKPTTKATDILSLAEMKRHLRIPPTITKSDPDIIEYIGTALDSIEGPGGELNRSIRPVTLKRWMAKFPDLRDDRGKVAKRNGGPILVPYGPLIELLAITIEDGASPPTVVDPATFVVKTGTLVPEIWPKTTWPDLVAAPRGVSVTYKAGHQKAPPKVVQYLKLLAAHWFENREATINDPRVLQVNRQIEFGAEYLKQELRIPVAYDDWGE